MSDLAARILVVDDDLVASKILSALLIGNDYYVRVVHSGDEVRQILEEDNFDLIALDIEMPGMSGLEVLKDLRTQYNALDLPVVMITGHEGADVVAEAYELGANDYITKPIHKDITLTRIKNALALNEYHRLQLMKEQMDTIKDMICTYNHEINNPLMVAMTAIDMEKYDLVKKSLKRMADIVRKIGELAEKAGIDREDYSEDSNFKLIKLEEDEEKKDD